MKRGSEAMQNLHKDIVDKTDLQFKHFIRPSSWAATCIRAKQLNFCSTRSFVLPRRQKAFRANETHHNAKWAATVRIAFCPGE